MRVITAIYDNKTKFILDIIKEFEDNYIVEHFNRDIHNERKTANSALTEFGTKNTPLVFIEDENLECVGAVWSEQNPDWFESINKLLP